MTTVPPPSERTQGPCPAPSPDTFYRGYRIDYYQPPIPWRGADWQFTHKDYDGPEDSRCGHAASYAEACAAIDEMEDEQ
jgi:hypothetical protein